MLKASGANALEQEAWGCWLTRSLSLADPSARRPTLAGHADWSRWPANTLRVAPSRPCRRPLWEATQ